MSPSKNLTDFDIQVQPDKNNDHSLKPLDHRQNQESRDGSILLSTAPVKASFAYRYLMALSPVFLVVVCILTGRFLNNIFGVATSSLTAAVPGYTSSITSFANVIILLIAPVGLFILFAAIGWSRRITGLWTGTVLTLGLSGATGIVLANFTVSQGISGDYILMLLQWISFLVQPFCVIATIIVILATEKFRRSIRYTLKNDGVWIQGGFWGIHEHMIPYNQIGGIVFEQDFLGKKYNFGTVIPQTITRLGANSSFRGSSASGQKVKPGAGIGFTKGQKDASREPLDCLYGIPDPKNVQKTLTGLIQRGTMTDDEHISLLKKIYETSDAGIITGRSGLQPPVLPVMKGFDIKDDTGNIADEGIFWDEKNPECQECTIIRVTDFDMPETTNTPTGNTTREIPPFKKPESDKKTVTPLLQADPPAESIFEQIKKLAELRDSGIITEQEFTMKKTELLKRI